MPKAAPGKKTKIQVVSEILNKGILKASDIVAAAKEMGYEITEATAANYKHQLGKSKPRKKKSASVPAAATTKVAKIVRTEGGAVSTDLELENLALRLIIKAGSAERAVQIIGRLG